MSDDPLVRKIAEALAERYTSPYGERNPDWDWEKPNADDNQYWLPESMDSRVGQSPYCVGVAPDGERFVWFPSIMDIAEVAARAVEEGVKEKS